MMNLKTAVTLLAVAAPSFAFAAAYDIDGAHSTAEFSVKHMMVSNVKGNFNVKSGTVNIDDKDITKSTVEAVLDANTVNTAQPKRDEHLKSPDFFDTAKYPDITFKSTKVAKAGKDKLKVSGDLTMHGVTKPVVLDVTGPTPEVKGMMGPVRGVEATTKINRKDFGLGWNKALEAGGVAVGEEIAITLNLELSPKKDAAPAAGATTK
jgi:polyisoprenoid-binding protein YceI